MLRFQDFIFLIISSPILFQMNKFTLILDEFGEEEEQDGVEEGEVVEEGEGETSQDGENPADKDDTNNGDDDTADPPQTVQKPMRRGRTRRESTEGITKIFSTLLK